MRSRDQVMRAAACTLVVAAALAAFGQGDAAVRTGILEHEVPAIVFVHGPDASEQVPSQPGDFLTALSRCFGGASGLVEVEGDVFFRIYAFQIVEEDDAGPRAIAEAIQRGRLKAAADAAFFFLDVATWFASDVLAEESSEFASDGVEQWERVLGESWVMESVATRAAGRVPGGRVRDMKQIALGEGNGQCVAIIYDIPIGD